MHIAAFVTVVAIVVGLVAPTWATDRPSDPFGNHTVELNKEAYLFGIFRDQVLLDRAHFHLCIESNNEPNNTDCAAVSTLMKIVEEARRNQGKAVLGHLNRSSRAWRLDRSARSNHHEKWRLQVLFNR